MSSIRFYQIRPFTNLHVGSGSTNIGLIDNQIQRDSTTGIPCIQSSGIKGALKQMLDHHQMSSPDLTAIFGSDATANKAGVSTTNQQGEAIFLSAHLLALPVRTDSTPFVLATCPELIHQFINQRADLNQPFSEDTIKLLKSWIDEKVQGVSCLDDSLVNANLNDLGLTLHPTKLVSEAIAAIQSAFGINHKKLCLIQDVSFMELVNNLNLPVIARNALDDGDSKNLWYEQVLPRESLLFFAAIWKDDTQRDKVEDILLKNPFQLGANASIGYGFTRVNTI